MGAGTVLAGESRESVDPATGARIRQVTAHPSINHHPFFYLPAWDDAMHHLVLVSHRTGRPELYAALPHEGWRLVQLTEHAGLNEWSATPSRDGRWVYFTDACGGWRVAVEDQRCERVVAFGPARRERGMVMAAMGTTALSACGRWWAVPVKRAEGVFHLLVVDTASGGQRCVVERETICHPEFHPDDPSLLRYGGAWHDRIRVVRRDGTGDRLAYRRDAARRQWIVHETWLPGTREIAAVDWPHGMIAVDVDSGAVREVCRFNAWHPAPDRTGTRMVADTTCPDRGLMLFDPRDGRGEPRPLCASGASNRGDHWDTDHCPYDDGPVTVYAPQHTHPHPSFSPDGRHVTFTSDRGGHAQVYVVEAEGP